MKTVVLRSAVIEAAIDRVWEVLRDFNSHQSWHPAIIRSQMENDLDGDVVGGVRRFSTADGAEIREQLLFHSDAEHTISYSILDSPLPLFDYVATLRLKPVTDGDYTFLDWRAQFRTSNERVAELEAFVGQKIYEDGIAGLRTVLSEKTPPSSEPPATVDMRWMMDAGKGDPLPSRAVVRAPADSPELVSLTELTVPAPTPGQIRIRLSALGINDMDLRCPWGADEAVNALWAPSIDGVGEIIDVGPHVHGLFPGDRIAYIDDSFGAYTAIRCIDADACIHLPDAITDIQASVLLKGIAAQLQLNRVFNAQRGSTIMLRPVSGGTGHLICQWAKSMGMIVMGTVSSAEAAKFSRRQGCDYPIFNSNDSSLKNDVMRVTNGRGVDFWVDFTGGVELDPAFSCMARLGHIAILGIQDSKSISIDVAALQQRSLTATAPAWHHYLGQRSYLQRLAHRFFTEIEKQNIIPVVETIPMSQAPEVFKQLKARQTPGALALIPG
jgi:NADPH:quinone reductase-like Zn-dependent oxidoreductase